MKRYIPILLCAVMTVGWAADCPEQQYLNWDSVPATIDPNKIAVNPDTGTQLFLDWRYATAGRPWTFSGWGCDDDGDALTFAAVGGTLTPQADGTYQVTGTTVYPGVVYVDVSVTDAPPDPNDAITVTGTFVLVVVPANRPPVIGCGSRP